VNGEVEVRNSDHNHTANASEVEARSRLAEMKELALNCQESPSQIIAQTVGNASRSVATSLSSSNLLSRTINNARQVKLNPPATPTSLETLQT